MTLAFYFTLFDLLGMQYTTSSCFIFYSDFSGLQNDAGKFFIFFLVLTLASVSAAAIAFSVSSSCSSYGVANAVVSLPYIFMMLFGGFLANIETILPWLAWIKWFSIFRYGINVSAFLNVSSST